MLASAPVPPTPFAVRMTVCGLSAASSWIDSVAEWAPTESVANRTWIEQVHCDAPPGPQWWGRTTTPPDGPSRPIDEILRSSSRELVGWIACGPAPGPTTTSPKPTPAGARVAYGPAGKA